MISESKWAAHHLKCGVQVNSHDNTFIFFLDLKPLLLLQFYDLVSCPFRGYNCGMIRRDEVEAHNKFCPKLRAIARDICDGEKSLADEKMYPETYRSVKIAVNRLIKSGTVYKPYNPSVSK